MKTEFAELLLALVEDQSNRSNDESIPCLKSLQVLSGRKKAGSL